MEKLKEKVWLSTPTMHGEELEFIQEAFDTNWIAPLGPNVNEFEKTSAEYVGVSSAAALSSGTAAIHLAYKLADIKEDDIVLVSDLTFSATVNPILYENAIPVFIDSEYETWNMDPIALEKALEKYKGSVKAVSIAHLYGTPAKLDEIVSLCNEYKVVLVEDAAESLSSTYKGKQTGSFGKYGILSYNGNKIITTSGGGMLVSDEKEDIEKARFWSTQAREPLPWYEHKELGYNYRMSNIVAGIGRGQMLYLEEHKEKKREIYKRYKERLKDLPLKMNPYLEESDPNFWLSCILLDEEIIESGKITPIIIREELEKHNIEARHIWKPMHL